MDGAGGGTRTRVCSLEGCRSTIELRPPRGAEPNFRAPLAEPTQGPLARTCRLDTDACGVQAATATLHSTHGDARRGAPSPRREPTHASGRLVGRCRSGRWWGKKDSNLRRQSHQIYSLTPLATREFPRWSSTTGHAPPRSMHDHGPGAPTARAITRRRVQTHRLCRPPRGATDADAPASSIRIVFSFPGSAPDTCVGARGKVEPAAGLEPATC